MSTGKTSRFDSASLEDTLRLGFQIGEKLRGGEVIELVSDLGGGKTAFVRGLARGLGSREVVRSPSFTISNQYRADTGLTLHHFDFYRLDEPGIMREEIGEIMADPHNVTAVEWGSIVDDVLPAKRLTVRLQATGENSRELQLTYPESLHYLIPRHT